MSQARASGRQRIIKLASRHKATPLPPIAWAYVFVIRLNPAFASGFTLGCMLTLGEAS